MPYAEGWGRDRHDHMSVDSLGNVDWLMAHQGLLRRGIVSRYVEIFDHRVCDIALATGGYTCFEVGTEVRSG